MIAALFLAASCSSGASLSTQIAAAKTGTVIQLASCYTGPVSIVNKTDLTLVGPSVIDVPLEPKGLHPGLTLTGDRGLTITGLKVKGSYNGTNGGVSYEGDTGVTLRDDHNLDLKMNVSNVQGDFADLLPATDDHLNTAITWNNSTMTGAGYHGITIEAADGATFTGDSFSHVAVDALDFEVDRYSTVFKNNQPTYAAEDNVTFSGDTFSSFGADWFASIQGQSPGVQEKGIRLVSNTIDSAAPLVEIKGTPTNVARYQTSGITISGNYGLMPARSTSGGRPGQPYVGAAMTIANATNVVIQNNYLPVLASPVPYLAVLKATGVSGLNLSANVFGGALGIMHPSSGTTTAVCANRYGTGAKETVPSCP